MGFLHDGYEAAYPAHGMGAVHVALLRWGSLSGRPRRAIYSIGPCASDGFFSGEEDTVANVAIGYAGADCRGLGPQWSI